MAIYYASLDYDYILLSTFAASMYSTVYLHLDESSDFFNSSFEENRMSYNDWK